MSKGLFLASSYEALFARAQDFLDHSETLVIAPSRGAAEDFLLTLPGAGTLGVHALSLTQLAVRLAIEHEKPGEPLSRLSQEALTARVVHSFLTQNRLHYFKPVGALPGFPRALARTLDEMRLEDCSSRSVAQTGDPGRDLSLLAGDYAAELTAAGLSDRAALFEAAIQVVQEGRHPWVGLPILLLDVPVRRKLEKTLVQELADRASRVTGLALSADDRSVKALQRCLRTLPARLTEDNPSTLARVRRCLFSTSNDAPAAADDTFSIFSAAGENLECMEIARRARNLAEAGTPFDAMAVLLRNPNRYQPLLQESFRRAGIPVYFHGGSVRPDPSGRAFLSLLRCAAERCSASRFAEYLSLAQTPELNPDGTPQRTLTEWTPPQDEVLAALETAGPQPAPPERPDVAPVAAPAAWERLLVDASVIGGADRWERRLQGLTNEIQLQLNQLTGDEEEGRQRTLERRLTQVQALSSFALPLVRLMGEFPAQATWGEWLDRLRTLAECSLRFPENVTATLEELRPMAAVAGTSLEVVYAVLEDRLRFLRREPPHYRYGCVFVAPLEDARARRFDVVFLPGLAEGIFPQRASEDPLLLDTFRSCLKPPLEQQDDRVAGERLLLHTAAAIATQKLIASYPRIDVGQSRPRVPSFYALELVRAAEGRLPELREFEKTAASSTPTRLGWPAPLNPADALDDTEYDLSRLGELAQLPPAARNGAARHLLEVSDSLARSLRTRWRRWNRKWSSADGLVDPTPAAAALLQRHRLGARAYSPTALQHYAVCPYQFFLHAIHRLREREQAIPLEQLDPLTRGALFHKIQERLLTRLGREDLLPLQMKNMAQLLSAADEVVNQVSAEYAENLAPAIPRVWASEMEDLRLDVRGWLRDAANLWPQWIPVHMELSFGLGGERDAVTLPIGVTLRGSVDLVERAEGLLRVTDHKTGAFPKDQPAMVGGGKALQPALYSMAVQQLLGLPVTIGRLYYCTHRGGYRSLDIPINPGIGEKARQVIEIIDDAIAGGFLPAAPDKSACDYCDYRVVCGPYEETRVSYKRKDRLEPLVKLRGFP